MGFVYQLHFVDANVQPEPAIDTLELKSPEAASDFVQRMASCASMPQPWTRRSLWTSR